MAELHIEGFIDLDNCFNITIGEKRSNISNYLLDSSVGKRILDFAESNGLLYCETEVGLGTRSTVIENASIRIFISDAKCTLYESEKRLLDELNGLCEVQGFNKGYDEFTILGLEIDTLRLGGHDLNKMLESHIGDYCHLIITV